MKVFLKKRSTVAESRLKSEILTFFENKKPQNKPIGFFGYVFHTAKTWTIFGSDNFAGETADYTK